MCSLLNERFSFIRGQYCNSNTNYKYVVKCNYICTFWDRLEFVSAHVKTPQVAQLSDRIG